MPRRIGLFSLARPLLIPAEATEMKTQVSPETKHIFAIKILDKLPGLFKPHRYLYHCARCKWSFVVNDGRSGAINPVDNDGNPLPDDESLKRIATFALGPCPAMQVLNVEAGPTQTSNGDSDGQADPNVHHEPRTANYSRRASTR
jgi:hypothetical protein